ncbi:Oxidoreductase/transition metal ion-binding protein [Hirschfeldia incana]|nr:Oxidoreductase/transition metal ion-binding protein [Hirschfeldia incana]
MMASTTTATTWAPSSLQLRIALNNYRSFRVAAPARAKMTTKLSCRSLGMTCAAQKKKNAAESDRFRGWVDDSGDDEMTPGGGDWFNKGRVVSGVAGMVLFVGLAFASLSFKRNGLRGPKVEVMVSVESSSDQVLETSHERGNVKMDQDDKESFNKDSSRDEIDVESKSVSTTKAKRYTSQEEFNGVDHIHASQIPDKEKKPRRFTGIPAPSTVPQVNPLSPPIFPAVVDPVQTQMFAALQALKVIESDARPYDLCTRREFARWLVSASNVLSRNSASKVYPAMYIENVTELAFDDITPEDPDFPFIQGLAEAGIISSRLSNHNTPSAESSPFNFSPESPLSRQDLLSWKMALEFRQLPEADSKKLYQLSGFLDIDKINPEAWPALIADLSAGEHGITALAFGRTRLFQPSKAVTKAQTATSLAIGEAPCEAVSEELARIQAEAMADDVVSAHNALVAQVEKEINASFEKELLREKETVDAVVKLAEEAKDELTKLRVDKEEETLAFEKERTLIETEMESLARLRNELEEQLQSLVDDKTEMSFEKERFDRLQKQLEDENREMLRLQNELEAERNALSIARNWAEDEARRATEQAKVLEEARGRWEKYGLKVIVDRDLYEQTTATTESTWLNVGKQQYSVAGAMNRGENMVAKLKKMAGDVREKSRDVIYSIVEKISLLISALRKQVLVMSNKAKEVEMKTKSKAEEFRRETSLKIGEIRDVSVMRAKEAVEEFKDRVWKLKSK